MKSLFWTLVLAGTLGEGGRFEQMLGQSLPAGSLDPKFVPLTNVGGPTGTAPMVTCLGLQSDGKIVVGGSFTIVNGAAAWSIVRLNQDGSPDASFKAGASVDYTINTLLVQPDNKILIGGDFRFVASVPRARIARLNSDGTLDTTFNPGVGADNSVRAFALQADGGILVGGDFTALGGLTRSLIARVSANGALDRTFDFNRADAIDFGMMSASAIALQPDSRIVVGGLFGFIDYSLITRHNNLIRLNSDGSLDGGFLNPSGATAPEPDDTVFSISLQPNGLMVIGGAFLQLGSLSEPKIARLKANGAVDDLFFTGSGVDQFASWVYATLLQPDGKVIAGGDFASINSVVSKGVARLNANGSVDTSFVSALDSGKVSALARQLDGNILIGGSFQTAGGGNPVYVARLLGSNTTVPLPNLRPFRPSGWADAIVLSSSVGDYQGAVNFFDDQEVFVDAAVGNDAGGADVSRPFACSLFLDNALVDSWNTDSLKAGSYTFVSGLSMGKLTAGTHALRLVADASQSVTESNEADNSYTITFTVQHRVLPPTNFGQPLGPGWTQTLVFGQDCLGCLGDGGGVYGHLGDDYGVPEGTPVYAIAAGEVTAATAGDNAGFGNIVTLKHTLNDGTTVYSLYAHLRDLNVTVGATVALGAQIATSGRTGLATGPHLHLAIKDKPDLGKGYAGSSFSADQIQIDGITYYRPMLFIEQHRPAIPGATAYVAGTDGIGLRLRAQPSIAASILLVLAEGSTVTLLDGLQYAEGYTWRKVAAQGQQGWVASRYLVFASEVSSSVPGRPINLAQLLGDASTSIPAQGQINSRTVVLSAQLPRGGTVPEAVQFEVRPSGSAFIGPTHESTYLTGGAIATVTLNGLADGGYHWRSRAVDLHGLASDWNTFGTGTGASTADFTVHATQGPSALFSFQPAMIFPGDSVHFTALAENPAGLVFSWDFGGGQTAQGQTVAQAFSLSGDYPVSLTVQNAAGQKATSSQTVSVLSSSLGDQIDRLVAITTERLNDILTAAQSVASAAEVFGADVDAVSARLVTGAVLNGVFGLFDTFSGPIENTTIGLKNFQEWSAIAVPQLSEIAGETALGQAVADFSDHAVDLAASPPSYTRVYIPGLQAYVQQQQQQLSNLHTAVLNSAANLTAAQARALTKDLGTRLAGNIFAANHYLDQVQLPVMYLELRQTDEESWTYVLAENLFSTSLGVLLSVTAPESCGVAAYLMPQANGIVQSSIDTLNLLQDQSLDAQMLALCVGALANGTFAARQVAENALNGLRQIPQAALLPPPAGSISVSNVTGGQINLFGFADLWIAANAHSEVTVQNTGTRPASFRVDARFDRTFTTTHLFPFDPLGSRTVDIQVLATSPSVSLGPGEQTVIPITYLGSGGGSIPTGPISFALSASTDDGFYYAAGTQTRFGTTFIDQNGQVLSPAQTAQLRLTSMPLASAGIAQGTNGAYRLGLAVTDTFDLPMLGTLAQQLPPDAQLLDAGFGIRNGDSLVWEVDLQPGASAAFHASFTSQLNQPLTPAVLSLRDPLNGVFLSLTNTPVVQNLDAIQPPVFTSIQPGSSAVSLSLVGRVGRPYRIEVSGDLRQWLPLAMWTNTVGAFKLDDSSASGVPHRFYRAVAP